MESYIIEDENGNKFRKTIHSRCPLCKHDDAERWDDYLEELYCGNCGLVMEAPYCPDLVFPGRIFWVSIEYL